MEAELEIKKEKIGYRDILRQKQYMKTVIAAIINRFGDSLDSIAFAWLVYQVTQSAAWSAIIFGLNRLPTIFLQPIVGAWVENKNKKRIMIVTDVIRGICVGFIATAMLLGFLNQWLLVGTTIIISCAEAFRQPAASALLPMLLDKKYYEFGLALSSSANSVMELVGLAAAGVIIGAFGVSTAIYIDTVTFFISAVIILTLKVKEEVVAKTKMKLAHYKQELKEGFLYIRDKKYLRYFVILAVYLNGILVPMNSLQSPLVSEVLHSNEIMLSVMSGLLTIGMLVGSVMFPYLRTKLSERALIQIGGFSIGVYYLSLIVIGQFVHLAIVVYLLVGALSLVFGLCVSLLTSFINVEFMKSVEANFMARVSALFGAVCVASMPIVSFIISLFAKFVDTSIIFIISGAFGILVCMFYCSSRRINRLMQNQTPEIEIQPEMIHETQPEMIHEVQPEMIHEEQPEIVSEEQPGMISEVELG